MGFTRQQIERRLRITPPTCVKGFRLLRARLPDSLIDAKFDPLKEKFGDWIADPRDDPHSVWRLACPCGHRTGNLLGHLLRDYSAVPFACDDQEFTGPLGFKCSSCGKITELLDTCKHGYHAEVAKIEGGIGSVTACGKGRRKSYRCPKCAIREFAITVAFSYWEGAVEVFLTEPGWSFEEYFNEFFCYCKCVGCGHTSEPTEFGKL